MQGRNYVDKWNIVVQGRNYVDKWGAPKKLFKKLSKEGKFKDLRALLSVVLKSHIASFSTTNYKINPALVEPKPNILASQL